MSPLSAAFLRTTRGRRFLLFGGQVFETSRRNRDGATELVVTASWVESDSQSRARVIAT